MSTPRCPACNEPSQPRPAAPAPFCSPQCKLVDLGRWLKGDYRLKTDETVQNSDELEHDGN